MTYSLLVSESKFSGSSLKSLSLGDVFIDVASGSPGALVSRLEPGTKAWSIGISDQGELLNPVGDVNALKSIFMHEGLLQVSQNAGIKCRKGMVGRVKEAIVASGIDESSFFHALRKMSGMTSLPGEPILTWFMRVKMVCLLTIANFIHPSSMRALASCAR